MTVVELPNEIMAIIFREAWLSSSSGVERTSLFFGFMLTGPNFTDVLAPLMVRYPRLCTTVSPPHALDAGLLDRAVNVRPRRPPPIPPSSRHININISFLEVTASDAQLFLFRDRWFVPWDAFLHTNLNTVVLCPSVTVSGTEHCPLLPSPAFSARSRPPSPHSPTSTWTSRSPQRSVPQRGKPHRRRVPQPQIHPPAHCRPSLLLRWKLVPPFPGYEWHREFCFPMALCAVAPGLEHLQFDTAFPLHHLQLPSRVRHLTLAATPVRIPGQEEASTLEGYGLVAALHGGLLRVTVLGDVAPRRLEIWSGTEMVVGYKSVVAVCGEYDIDTLKVVHWQHVLSE
ncbi:uncharacterized protein BXZ73DRAFT_106427 [Epithele typhae]|uniref:uncharacterized protein n=1 Tax=Epithele typhae TaxID=378194 RepID=UPI0020080C46|nr:uncharacterized protein BXZ73DRAFT_106427 [Epithele typhae]KAH9914918.1 hypothetical protein BXZ73DRAFT_106427 [Epithele typhae]